MTINDHFVTGLARKTLLRTRGFNEFAAHAGPSIWKSDEEVGLGNSAVKGSIGICPMNKGYAYDEARVSQST